VRVRARSQRTLEQSCQKVEDASSSIALNDVGSCRGLVILNEKLEEFVRRITCRVTGLKIVL
jgi:hypothetical protein